MMDMRRHSGCLDGCARAATAGAGDAAWPSPTELPAAARRALYGPDERQATAGRIPSPDASVPDSAVHPGSRIDASGGAAAPPADVARLAGAALDKHASNVSPLPQPLGDRGDHGGTKSADPPPVRSWKRERHRLRRASGRIVGGRVKSCGGKPLGISASLVRRPDTGHHFESMETCGSVWVCPVCAAKITEQRKADVEAVLAGHMAAGGRAYMATMTIPHHRFQTCRELRKAVSAAWRKVKNGKGWQRARSRYGWDGDIRAMEITHGDNGWHPHLHVLILFRPGIGKASAESFGGWLFEAWAAAIRRLGYGDCSRSAFRFDQVNAATGASDYVSKWGAACELTKGHIKKARSGRTPWQLLDDAAGGDKEAAALFADFANAMKGARQLTWSRGLRDRYLLEPEADDEAVAADPDKAAEQVAEIHRDLFAMIERRGLTAEILIAADTAGLGGVAGVLRRARIPFAVSSIPGRGPGETIPLLHPPSFGESRQGHC